MSIGVWQVILILAIVLIIFGAGKLPRVMGDLAKGVKNFKSGMKDEDETVSAKQIDDDGGEPMANVRSKEDEAAKT